MTTRYDDIDDDLLRHYYEKELDILRRDMRAFAQRNPEAAARLSINSDGRSDDPGVERLAQSTALLNARHSVKIDDDYPEFSEAVIQRTYPQYLRPFPSSAVAQFDVGSMFNSLTEPVRVERGTPLETAIGRFSFRTAYDVVLAPVQITHAKYAPASTIPPSVKVPADTSGVFSITFRAAKADGQLAAAAVTALRVHLAGQPAMVAALTDTLLLRTTRAYVENREGHWTRLTDVPLKTVGFGLQDWLCTDAKEPGQPFGLLGEYFAFPQRFQFIDVDFASVCAAVPAGQLTLHLVVTNVAPNSPTAQQLVHVCADHLKLFCTPVVNLFKKEGVSLKCDRKTATWPISIESKNDAPTEVWAVERVCTERGKPLPSSDGLMTAIASKAHPRWALVQPPRSLALSPIRESALRLASDDGAAGAGSGIETLVADVSCCNGDLPRTVTIGNPEGDVRMEGNAQAAKKIALLHAPTAVTQLPRKDGALWRLIGQQTAHAIRLNQAGLPALKQILQQFAALSPQQARHLDGIRGLRHRLVMTLMVRKPQPVMVRGIEVTLEIDEQRFAEHSVAVFAGVMERYFAPYAPHNSFVQLIVLSTNGGILWRGEPIPGARSPL